MPQTGYFHLHLVSDSTGETLITVARAAAAQYAHVQPVEHVYPMVRTKKQLDHALNEIAETPGLVMAEDAGRGWRTLVASPRPVDIVERDSILNLLDHEFIVVACGGGGIPVVRDAGGDHHGVRAVIDKDFASAKLAEVVGADYLFILTAVERVAVGFGTPQQQDLDELDLATAQRYVDDGQFGAGSMKPKVQAAMGFVASGPGRRAVICALEKAPLAMSGATGTVIHS